jgi:hypothetical protein
MKIIRRKRLSPGDSVIGNTACLALCEADLARAGRCAQADDR